MLLTKPHANTKLRKSQGKYIVVGLSLAPNTVAGYNTCTSSSSGCRAECLNYSGMAVMYPNVIEGRIRKTKWFFENRTTFVAQLQKELNQYKVYAKKQRKKLAVRLNVFSDIMWEKIIKLDSDIQFYDYTKHYKRYLRFLSGDFPKNYDLTFSRSENNEDKCIEILNRGGRSAFVFDKVPEEYLGFPVVNGDETDLRFLDPPGIVGLKSKSKAKGGVMEIKLHQIQL